MQRDEKNRKNEEKEKHDKPKKVDEKDRQEESKKAREKPKEALKEAPKEAIKNNKLDKVNQQLDEEGDVAIKVEEEEEKVASTLQISNYTIVGLFITIFLDFEEYRFENDKKKMVTTSTKISKATHNEGKKAEPKQKEAVSNPGLRKKICLKMSKILQEKYGLSKDAAQEITLRTESKIRHINPDMQTEYKDKVLTILKLLKVELLMPFTSLLMISNSFL